MIGELLTIIQVAETLKVSKNTVKRLLASGRLPATRIPGLGERACKVLVAADALDAAVKRWSIPENTYTFRGQRRESNRFGNGHKVRAGSGI